MAHWADDLPNWASWAKHCSFEAWLDATFGDATYDCWIPGPVEAAYVATAFEHADTILARYSNEQLKRGLWNFVSSATGSMNDLISMRRSPWAVSARCIRSIYDVYEKLFAKRCSSGLSHLNESSDNPLNGICYIWWDILPVWSFKDEPEIELLFLDVMARTLKLDSDACREGALHGLGHLNSRHLERHDVIDAFLADNRNLRPELKAYAERARSGNIL